MPNIDPPDQTQVKGTIKSAAQVRVVAPAVKPSGSGWYQAPEGGELRSTGPGGGATEERRDERILLVPPRTSDGWKVLPQARHRATSVVTLMSSDAIFERQDG